MTSEAVEMLKDMKELKREERQVKANCNLALLKELNINAHEQSKNVFRIDTKFGAVMYYPPSGKWQHNGRTMMGDVYTFRDWLKAKHFL